MKKNILFVIVIMLILASASGAFAQSYSGTYFLEQENPDIDGPTLFHYDATGTETSWGLAMPQGAAVAACTDPGSNALVNGNIIIFEEDTAPDGSIIYWDFDSSTSTLTGPFSFDLINYGLSDPVDIEAAASYADGGIEGCVFLIWDDDPGGDMIYVCNGNSGECVSRIPITSGDWDSLFDYPQGMECSGSSIEAVFSGNPAGGVDTYFAMTPDSGTNNWIPATMVDVSSVHTIDRAEIADSYGTTHDGQIILGADTAPSGVVTFWNQGEDDILDGTFPSSGTTTDFVDGTTIDQLAYEGATEPPEPGVYFIEQTDPDIGEGTGLRHFDGTGSETLYGPWPGIIGAAVATCTLTTDNSLNGNGEYIRIFEEDTIADSTIYFFDYNPGMDSMTGPFSFDLINYGLSDPVNIEAAAAYEDGGAEACVYLLWDNDPLGDAIYVCHGGSMECVSRLIVGGDWITATDFAQGMESSAGTDAVFSSNPAGGVDTVFALTPDSGISNWIPATSVDAFSVQSIDRAEIADSYGTTHDGLIILGADTAPSGVVTFWDLGGDDVLEGTFPSSGTTTDFKDGTTIGQLAYEGAPGPGSTFIRGDANNDGKVDIADIITIGMNFYEGAPLFCEDYADVDDEGIITTDDIENLWGYLWSGGESPSSPFPTAGYDPTTGDEWSCGDDPGP